MCISRMLWLYAHLYRTPPGAGHRVVVEGLSSQSVRPFRGLTGEARSRPGVTEILVKIIKSSGAGVVRHGGRIIDFLFTVVSPAVLSTLGGHAIRRAG